VRGKKHWKPRNCRKTFSFHLLKQLNQAQITVTLENSWGFLGTSELVRYENLKEKNTSGLVKKKIHD